MEAFKPGGAGGVEKFGRQAGDSLCPPRADANLCLGTEAMKRVVIESPLKGDYERNRAYAKLAVRDCLKRGEAPYASHLFFDQPGILDDRILEERELGIKAGYAWGDAAQLAAFYMDLGMSDGMRRALERWSKNGVEIEYRYLFKALADQEFVETSTPPAPDLQEERDDAQALLARNFREQ